MKTSTRSQIQRHMLGIRKLRPSEIQREGAKLLQRQKGKCPLCGDRILPDDAVLDHNHSTGYCRATLHRTCNSLEGKITNWLNRYANSTDPIQFLRNLIEYWEEDYSKNPLHPTHKTDHEKEITKCRKKIRTLKTERGKQKYRDRIKELQEIMNESSSTGR